LLRAVTRFLSENATAFSAAKDLIAIVAVPAAAATFFMAVMQYNNSVHNDRARTFLESRKRFQELAKTVTEDRSPNKELSHFLIFQEMETLWFLQQFGLLDPELWTTYKSDICRTFKIGGQQSVALWEKFQAEFAQPFVKFVNDTHEHCS
jgi:hypothetical protein